MKKHLLFILAIIALTVSPLVSLAKPDNDNGQKAKAANTDTAKQAVDKQAVKDEKSADREAKKAEINQAKADRDTERLEKAKERALAAIDRRIDNLEKASNRIVDRKRIRETEQAEIQQEIDAMIATLEASKGKIEAATDVETLRQIVKEAIDSSKVNAVIIPKIRAIAMTSALYNAMDRIGKVFVKIEEAIKANPDKSAEANSLLTLAKTNLSDAKTKTDLAFAEFKLMKPSLDAAAAKSHFTAGKNYLTEARDSIHKTVQNLNDIKELLYPDGEMEQEQEQEQERTLEKTKTKTPKPAAPVQEDVTQE